MKKLIQICLLSIGLIGCSSIDYSELTLPVSPSVTQLNRILALGLTHAENLILARKITDSSVASTVINELENRKTKTDNENIDAEKASKIAEMVEVSDGNSKFLGPKISEIKKRNMVGKPENLDYFLISLKDQNNGLIQHKLNFSITHTSEQKRIYSSASFCDKWQGCGNESLVDISLISSSASDCSSFECDYTEKMELNLTDDFLRSYMKDGLSINFNSKKANNKLTLTKFYLKGYLSVAN